MREKFYSAVTDNIWSLINLHRDQRRLNKVVWAVPAVPASS